MSNRTAMAWLSDRTTKELLDLERLLKRCKAGGRGAKRLNQVRGVLDIRADRQLDFMDRMDEGVKK